MFHHPYYGPLSEADGREVGQLYDVNGNPIDLQVEPVPRRTRAATIRAEIAADTRRVAELRAETPPRKQPPPPPPAAPSAAAPTPPKRPARQPTPPPPSTADTELTVSMWRRTGWR
jgi:hypothetical protein